MLPFFPHKEGVMSFSQIFAVIYFVLCLPLISVAADFEITGYELVSQTRVGRTTFDYTYRAILKNNSSSDITSATATLTSLISSVSIIDGQVTFPETAIGTTSKSTDTFKFRTDRAVKFDQSYLPWNIVTTAGAVSTPNPAKTNFADALIAGRLTDTDLYIGDNFKNKFEEIVITLNAEQLKDLGQTVKDGTITFSSDKFAEFETIIKFNDGTNHLGKFQMNRTESGWKFFNL